jgi:hypothetical protein
MPFAETQRTPFAEIQRTPFAETQHTLLMKHIACAELRHFGKGLCVTDV